MTDTVTITTDNRVYRLMYMLGYFGYAALLILSFVFYKERAIFMDSAFHLPGFIKKMNNEEVYNTSHQDATIEMRNTENKIKMEIGVALSNHAKKLGKGNYVYDLHNVVIDKKGKIVYYELKGI